VTYSFQVVIRRVVDGHTKDEVLGEIELSGDPDEMIYDLPDSLRALADDIEEKLSALGISESDSPIYDDRATD